MNQIIVVGNIQDSNNVFCASGRVYDGGGYRTDIRSITLCNRKIYTC